MGHTSHRSPTGTGTGPGTGTGTGTGAGTGAGTVPVPAPGWSGGVHTNQKVEHVEPTSHEITSTGTRPSTLERTTGLQDYQYW